MQVFFGLLYIIVGVFCIWVGSFSLITSMVPKEIGIEFAEAHGAWIRENVLHLPKIDKETD